MLADLFYSSILQIPCPKQRVTRTRTHYSPYTSSSNQYPVKSESRDADSISLYMDIQGTI